MPTMEHWGRLRRAQQGGVGGEDCLTGPMSSRDFMGGGLALLLEVTFGIIEVDVLWQQYPSTSTFLRSLKIFYRVFEDSFIRHYC